MSKTITIDLGTVEEKIEKPFVLKWAKDQYCQKEPRMSSVTPAQYTQVYLRKRCLKGKL